MTAVAADHERFGVLIDRYEPKLRRYITRLGVRNADEQDDVLQDIFIKAYRKLYTFDTDLSFSSWIYRIAHNEAVSWFRKRNVRPEGHMITDSDDVLVLVRSDDASPEVSFDQSLNAAEVQRALAALPEKYRIALMLRYFEHKEYDEISDILQIPVGSVGTLIHRGKKQLHSLINQSAVRV